MDTAYKILQISEQYIKSDLGKDGFEEIQKRSSKVKSVSEFIKIYCQYLKEVHRNGLKPPNYSNNVNIYWNDCLYTLQTLPKECIQLICTSPPYYNAREYSQWKDLESYLTEMKQIIIECYRVLDNHRYFVINVGDITGNDNKVTNSPWGNRRIPLSTYFINIFEEVGFQFIDDFIWDKGEVQSHRHKNPPHPLYQYPMNCYEHILVFIKHRLDQYRYPCPVCGCLKVNGNSYSDINVKSWECKNEECLARSKGGRGKRFSSRTILMESLKNNIIDKEFSKEFRRDIVKINPVIKINCKGQNILGHTAPFPNKIAEMAVKLYTGKDEIVLDPFAGSFTTPIVAVKEDRIGVGIEKNKNFKTAIITNITNNGLKYNER